MQNIFSLVGVSFVGMSLVGVSHIGVSFMGKSLCVFVCRRVSCGCVSCRHAAPGGCLLWACSIYPSLLVLIRKSSSQNVKLTFICL